MTDTRSDKSLKRNVLMSAILALSNVLFPLISFKYVTGILLPAGTGRVSFATSVLSCFLIFAQLGIPTYGIRECAKVRDDKAALSKLVRELLSISAVTTLISYAVFAGALFAVPRLAMDKPLFVVSSAVLFLNCIGMEWLYRGLERYTYITVRSVIFKAIGVIAMFLLIHTENDYVMYAALVVFSGSCSYILNFFGALKYVRPAPSGKLEMGKHISAVWVFLAMTACATFYTHLDMLMLGFMKTDVDTGYYDAAVKIKTILVSLVISLGAALLPRSSKYLEEGRKEEFRKITRSAMNLVVLLALPLSLFFIIYARESVLAVSGTEYLGAVLPMKVIMFTVLLIGMSNITGIQILVPLGKEMVVLWSEIIGVVVDFVLNIILIPVLSSTGAAIGTLTAEVAVLIYQYVKLGKERKGLFSDIRWALILGAAALASAASLLVKLYVTGSMNEYLAVIIGGAVFFGLYLGVLLIGKEPFIMRQLKR